MQPSNMIGRNIDCARELEGEIDATTLHPLLRQL
jgi:hypothetical protein